LLFRRVFRSNLLELAAEFLRKKPVFYLKKIDKITAVPTFELKIPEIPFSTTL
jgi:hypothetical protein